MDYSARENLYELPAPRKVRLSVIIGQLLAWNSNTAQTWFITTLAAGYWLYAGFSAKLALVLLVTFGPTATAQGEVTGRGWVEGSRLGVVDGEAESVDTLDPVLGYEYVVDGQKFEGRSSWDEFDSEYMELDSALRFDDEPPAITIEYSTLSPDVSRLGEADWYGTGGWTIWFFAIGMMVLWMFNARNAFRGAKRCVVLREGIIAGAELANTKRVSSGDEPEFVYTYRLTTRDGGQFDVTHQVVKSEAGAVTDDAVEPVLYLARDPTQHILFDSLADATQLDARGDLVTAESSSVFAALFFPTLAAGLMLASVVAVFM